MEQKLLARSGQLSPHQLAVLKKASPTVDDIFKNMDALNEEIDETYGDLVQRDSEVSTSSEHLVPKLPKTNVMKNKGVLKVKQLPKQVTPTLKEEKMVESENELDRELDAELEAVQKKATVAVPSPQKQAQPEEANDPLEQHRQRILDLLKKTPGAPTEAQIGQLKDKYGKNSIYVMAFAENDLYIYTFLKRGQWQKIQKIVQAAVAADATKDGEELLRENVIKYCVLWPKAARELSLEFLYNSRAGLIDSLYQAILLNSYFLAPQQSMLLSVQV